MGQIPEATPGFTSGSLGPQPQGNEPRGFGLEMKFQLGIDLCFDGGGAGDETEKPPQTWKSHGTAVQRAVAYPLARSTLNTASA